MLFCLLSFKYFATRGKNVYEQLTVCCVGSFLFNVFWHDLLNKHTFAFVCKNHRTLSLLELNFERVVSLDIPYF